MAEPDPIPLNAVRLAPGVYLPEAALHLRFVRGRGPGGQNVNKLSSAAELRVKLSDLATLLRPSAIERLRTLAGSKLTQDQELLIFADEHRSQEQNRDAAIDRLGELVRTAVVEPKRRRKTKPSRASQQRRVDSKKRRGEIKSMRKRLD
jgi:ribosome-associated protein